MLICTPASSWRTGSVETIVSYWLPSVVAFLNIGALSSVRQCRKCGAVLAVSGLTNRARQSFLRHRCGPLRFFWRNVGNVNDLAMLLLLGPPFFLIPFLDTVSKGAVKFLALAAALLMIAVSFALAPEQCSRWRQRYSLLARSPENKLAGDLMALAVVVVAGDDIRASRGDRIRRAYPSGAAFRTADSRLDLARSPAPTPRSRSAGRKAYSNYKHRSQWP
jgi:hypothetical protein